MTEDPKSDSTPPTGQDIAALQAEVAELRRRNQILEGRLDQMETRLGGFLGAVAAAASAGPATRPASRRPAAPPPAARSGSPAPAAPRPVPSPAVASSPVAPRPASARHDDSRPLICPNCRAPLQYRATMAGEVAACGQCDWGMLLED